MLTKLIYKFMPELTAIEARTYKIIKKGTGNVLYQGRYTLNKENLLWLPGLCLLSAKIAKDTNVKVVQLAGVLHLLSIASHLHWTLPEKTDLIEMKHQIQYPILIGDLLYSKVYADICQHGLQQYLTPLTSLIGSIQEELVLKDMKEQNNLPKLPHEIKIFAMMSESACFLGAHSVAGNNFITEKLREIGFHLGQLKAVAERGADISCYLSSWDACWKLLECLSDDKDREQFQHILQNLGSKLGLGRPPLLECIV